MRKNGIEINKIELQIFEIFEKRFTNFLKEKLLGEALGKLSNRISNMKKESCKIREG